jgi:hypothetical protein
MATRDKICEFKGCQKPAYSRGLCRGHYGQWWRNKELRPLRRPDGEPPLPTTPATEIARLENELAESERCYEAAGSLASRLYWHRKVVACGKALMNTQNEGKQTNAYTWERLALGLRAQGHGEATIAAVIRKARGVPLDTDGHVIPEWMWAVQVLAIGLAVRRTIERTRGTPRAIGDPGAYFCEALRGECLVSDRNAAQDWWDGKSAFW